MIGKFSFRMMIRETGKKSASMGAFPDGQEYSKILPDLDLDLLLLSPLGFWKDDCQNPILIRGADLIILNLHRKVD
jgi:hypothetical protein